MTISQKKLTTGVGVFLLIIGIAGFFTSGSLLVFGVNALHNTAHILTALVGLSIGLWGKGVHAALFNKTLGLFYVVVAVLGMAFPAFMAMLLAINMPDNILHFLLGVILAGVGFASKKD